MKRANKPILRAVPATNGLPCERQRRRVPTLTPRGGYLEGNGLHHSQDRLQWSTFVIATVANYCRQCRQMIQINH
jgi:hypothetical protein